MVGWEDADNRRFGKSTVIVMEEGERLLEQDFLPLVLRFGALHLIKNILGQKGSPQAWGSLTPKTERLRDFECSEGEPVCLVSLRDGVVTRHPPPGGWVLGQTRGPGTDARSLDPGPAGTGREQAPWVHLQRRRPGFASSVTAHSIGLGGRGASGCPLERVGQGNF